MAKYHASNKYGKPMCGQTGAIGGFTAVCVKASDWNTLECDEKCQKCILKIREMKASKESK